MPRKGQRMKNKDLVLICIQNLTRHMGRTMLTVLGVLVGCCSIIIMISIGIGMKERQDKMLLEMGDLTIITVYPLGSGGKSPKLDDNAIKKIREIEKVEIATPKLKAEGVNMALYAGADRRYLAEYTEIVGIDPEAARKLGYQLLDGTWSEKKSYKVQIGENFAYSFSDTKRPEGRNTVDIFGGENEEDGSMNMPPAFFDPMKTPLTIEIDSGKGDDKKFTQKLEVTGRLKEDYGKGMETSMGVVMRTEDLEVLLNEQARLTGVKRNKRKGYDTAIVKAVTMQDVASVESAIQKMGYRTNSMESIRKPMEKEARQKQMMFGGLGAISLFVAALGITNTMIMSITERTREIGVMKSLGCFVDDIRKMFLLEAGMIGFLGGMAGTVLSLIISGIMNLVSGEMTSLSAAGIIGTLTAKGERLSVIPWWLSAFALVFSIVIGVGAGYYPANQAVSIPALEAIKHD